MQAKASRVGFDWPDVEGALEKLSEEVTELAQASLKEDMEAEMGDVFFALVNVARLKGIDPEAALQGSNDKFLSRFEYIEEKIKEKGKDFSDFNLEQLDEMWDEAKANGL